MKYLRLRREILVLLLFISGIGLTSCDTSSSTGEANLEQPLATSVVETIEPANATATTISTPTTGTDEVIPVTAPSLSPTTSDTPVPTSTPASITTLVPCGSPPAVATTTLDLNSLSWEIVEAEDQTIRRIAVPTFLPFLLSISPDNRWLATAFENIGGEAYIALIDTQEGTHWWVNTQAYQVANMNTTFSQWLPDGDVVWFDETGRLFVGDEQNHQTWEAPVKIRDIKVAANHVAFIHAEGGGLWRVDLASGQWEEVTTTQPPMAGTLGGYFGIAHDGSYAFSFQFSEHGAEMWRIPAEMGAAAELLPGIEQPLEILGSGQRAPLPHQLAHTPLWLINLPFALKGSVLSENSIFGSIVVDTRQGTVQTAEGVGLPAGFYLTEFDLSSDGSWLSTVLVDGVTRQATGLYLTPADDLRTGRIIGNSNLTVAGWHTEAPAVILRDAATGTLSVASLPPADEATGIPLAGAGELLTTLPDSLITTAAGHPARVLQFDLNGNLLNTLDLTADYESVEVGRSAAGRVYLSAVGRQSQESSACRYGLLEWTPGTVSPSTP